VDIMNDNIILLQNEVAYYKKQLNNMAGSVVSRDYRMAELNNEIKQLKTGFALLAALNQFKFDTNIDDIYDHFTECINIDLQNDLSFILQPISRISNYFGAHFIKGNPKLDTSAIQHQSVYIDTSFIEQKNSLLVNSQTESTPFIQRMVQAFAIPYFILSPIFVNNQLAAYIFTGRKIETVLFAASRLLLHDVHTLEAIAGVLAAIKTQQAQFELLGKERTRISREMHDDIGAGLTQITLMSESINKNKFKNIKELTDISETSRKLVASMSEIIWSMNPANNTLDEFFAFMREDLYKLLEYSGIVYKICLPDNTNDTVLNTEQKRNLLLVVKEIVHNAVKYSKAGEIVIKAELTENVLQFLISDNGIGFDIDKQTHGNGLHNIQKRISDLDGTISIKSEQNSGSVFNFFILLKSHY
jgi:signal transduction histidine kinase